MANSHETTDQVDPDFFGMISLVISTLALVAQVTDLKFPIQKPNCSTRTSNLEQLTDALEKSVRDANKLSRILRSATTEQGSNVTQQPFIYGATQALLPNPQFTQLQQLVGQLGLNAGTTGTWVLHIILHDPEMAEALGEAIKGKNANIPQKIREMYSGTMTNEEVLDEVVTLLRQFLAAAEQLNNHN